MLKELHVLWLVSFEVIIAQMYRLVLKFSCAFLHEFTISLIMHTSDITSMSVCNSFNILALLGYWQAWEFSKNTQELKEAVVCTLKIPHAYT